MQRRQLELVAIDGDQRREDAPEHRAFGAEIEAVITPIAGLQLFGNASILRAEMGAGIDSLVGKRLDLAPTTIGSLVATLAPRQVRKLQLKADWHWVGSRLTESPLTRIDETKLPAYDYLNFGLGLTLPGSGIRINADLLNAFQSKGLEEGNPRLLAAGEQSLFLARPILPRRFQVWAEYDLERHPAR